MSEAALRIPKKCDSFVLKEERKEKDDEVINKEQASEIVWLIFRSDWPVLSSKDSTLGRMRKERKG